MLPASQILAKTTTVESEAPQAIRPKLKDFTLTTRNRIHNAHNPYQGKFKRVLCVCSAGLLRAPTAAYVLSQEPFNYNTRAVGHTDDFALIPIDAVHVAWADEIVFVEPSVRDAVLAKFPHLSENDNTPRLVTLQIPDIYGYRDPKLVGIIRDQYQAATNDQP